MSEVNLALIAELDAMFSAPVEKKKKNPAKAKVSFPPVPLEPEFWKPVAVVLVEETWQCSCGCEDRGTPQVYLQEQFGRNCRLRALNRASNYAGLPRKRESIVTSITSCPHCFPETPDNQLQFPFPEDLAPFQRAVIEVFDYLAVKKEVEEQIARIVRTDPLESYIPSGIEHEVVFDTGRCHTHYQFSSSVGEEGPEIPEVSVHIEGE